MKTIFCAILILCLVAGVAHHDDAHGQVLVSTQRYALGVPCRDIGSTVKLLVKGNGDERLETYDTVAEAIDAAHFQANASGEAVVIIPIVLPK